MMTATPKRIRTLLLYDKSTGLFKWKNPSSRQAKSWFRGSKGLRKYRKLYIDGRHYLAHTVAWIIVKGKYPRTGLDHKDRDQGNNRWRNLREATQDQNAKNRSIAKNNTTKVTGVSACDHRFKAYIRINNEYKHLGVFGTIADAAYVRRQAERKYFGNFAGQ